MYIKTSIWYFIKRVSSLRFSVSLLLLLASASILGTIIEQDQALDYYKANYPGSSLRFFSITWQHIIAFGLNHVYSTYWFFVILFLFFLSLLLCTFSTQLPLLKSARRWNFLYSQASLGNKFRYTRFQYSSLLNFAYVLSLSSYYVFQKGKALYAYKGLVGRIAPVFVHFSIILTLMGSVIGFTNGFMAQEMIPSGEIFHMQNFVKSGYFSSVPDSLLGRIDDFFVVFNADNSIQQFFSRVSLLDHKGRILAGRSISVNSPLRFHGVTLYQTDWKISALRLKIGSSVIVKSLQRSTAQEMTAFQPWLCGLSVDDRHKIWVAVPSLNNELLIYSDQGVLIKVTHYGLRNVIYGVPIVFKDIVASTGIQVKSDPGLGLAYLGFLILIVNISISYMSYSQVWVSKSVKMLHSGGSSTRAVLAFEDELSQICKKYMYLFRFG